MRSLRAWFSRFLALFGKGRRERELSAEMESHLQLHIEDRVRAGMPAAQARREALMKLGGVEQTKESYRARRSLPLLDVALQDLRFAARMLGKNMGFTLVAVLTLALGIASNATIFTFVNAILYKVPPVREPNSLMVVFGVNAKRQAGSNLFSVSAPNYFSWRKANQVFSDVAAIEPYGSASLTGEGEPERVRSTRVTANYFSLIGVNAELGRTFVSGEDQPGHDHVVILHHDLWERKFGADAKIVGKTIRLNRENYTVIGVVPQRFRIMSFLSEMWTPLVLDEAQQSGVARENRSFYLFGRLKPGTTVAQAQANIRTLGTLTEQGFPEAENGWGAGTLTLQEFLIRDFNAGAAFAILLSAVGFVLLIACTNIAGLLLARATSRSKEMAVRIAMGAGRMRVIRQLMTEAMLIAFLGAGAGLGLTLFGNRIMRAALSFNDAVKMLELNVDWRVLAFTSVIAVGSALIFGLVPAVKAWAVEVFPTLKNDSTTVTAGKKKNRMRSILVAGEVALAVVLLSAAGILIKGFVEGMSRGLGFEPSHLLTAQISLPDSRYKEPAKQVAFYRELVSRLDAIPGASAAAVASVLPAAGPGFATFRLKGQENVPRGERARARYVVISPDFFSTTETPIVAGRDFSQLDDAKSPAVAIINEKLAAQFFPKGDALGNVILVDSGDGVESQWRQIVGIVRNVKSWPLEQSDDAGVYEPYAQHPTAEMALIVGASGNPNSLGQGLRDAVWSVDDEQPVGSVISMPDLLAKESAGDRIMGGLMGTFGALALMLAGIGIYGLVAFTVGQRSQEIGIRVALGAERGSILKMVLRDGMQLAFIGLAIGLLGALPLPRAFESVFQDFRVAGTLVFAVVAVLIGSVALLACAVPARRAARVDPIIALRYE